MHVPAKSGVQRMGAAALLAVVLIGLLLIGYSLLNHPQETEKRATTDSIIYAIETSPVTVAGTVADVKRSQVDISVNHVIRGNLEPAAIIQVTVPDVKTVKAGLKKGEEYIFALAPSLSDPVRYYGMIEPFIFQLKDGHAIAITGDSELKAAFRDTKVTVEELAEKYSE